MNTLEIIVSVIIVLSIAAMFFAIGATGVALYKTFKVLKDAQKEEDKDDA